MKDKYSIALFREGGERAGIERMLAHHDDLSTAYSLYKAHIKDNRGRLLMLCDRAWVLARSDRQ
jgi:hypothetical protein